MSRETQPQEKRIQNFATAIRCLKALDAKHDYSPEDPLFRADVRYSISKIENGPIPDLLRELEACHRILFCMWEVETHPDAKQALADQLTKNTIAISKAKES